jgi:hypothetical protein
LKSELPICAAADEQVPVTRDDRGDGSVAPKVMCGRDWSVHVNPVPRETDIARLALLVWTAEALSHTCGRRLGAGVGADRVVGHWQDERRRRMVPRSRGCVLEAATTGQSETSCASAAKWFGGQSARFGAGQVGDGGNTGALL